MIARGRRDNRVEKPIWLPSATAKCKTSAASAVLRSSRLPTRPQPLTRRFRWRTVLVRFHAPALAALKGPAVTSGERGEEASSFLDARGKRTRARDEYPIDPCCFNAIPLETLFSCGLRLHACQLEQASMRTYKPMCGGGRARLR